MSRRTVSEDIDENAGYLSFAEITGEKASFGRGLRKGYGAKGGSDPGYTKKQHEESNTCQIWITSTFYGT
jgi:hypothetical protein